VTGRASMTDPIDPNHVLLQYCDVFIGAKDASRAQQIRDDYASGKEVKDGLIKAELGEAINALIAPMRERRAKYETAAGEAMVLDVIRDGIKRANKTAEETLTLAKKAMKLDFVTRVIG
jgi:tryptophanyl-tRNA synthetase